MSSGQPIPSTGLPIKGADNITYLLKPFEVALPGTASTNLGGVQGAPNMIPFDVNLPTGASTSALQTAGNSILSTIATNTASGGALPTGASTSALQTTGNALLTTIAANTGNIALSPPSTNGPLTPTNPAVTTASTQALAANANRKFITLENQDNAVTVWYRFGSTATTNAASMRLLPGASRTLEGSFLPDTALNIIGSAASSNLHVEEG